MNSWIGLIVGYSFAVIIGYYCIAPVVDGLWAGAGRKKQSDTTIRPAAYLPRLVGIVERVLFVASIQLEKAEFIGVWLALKVAGQWKRWGEGVMVENSLVEGRVYYNIFLIGSALSIAYSLVGAQLISSITDKNWELTFGLPMLLLVGTLALHQLAVRYQSQASDGVAQSKPDQNI